MSELKRRQNVASSHKFVWLEDGFDFFLQEFDSLCQKVSCSPSFYDAVLDVFQKSVERMASSYRQGALEKEHSDFKEAALNDDCLLVSIATRNVPSLPNLARGDPGQDLHTKTEDVGLDDENARSGYLDSNDEEMFNTDLGDADDTDSTTCFANSEDVLMKCEPLLAVSPCATPNPDPPILEPEEEAPVSVPLRKQGGVPVLKERKPLRSTKQATARNKVIDETAVIASAQKVPPTVSRQFVCSFCGKNMYFAARLRIHIDSKHKETMGKLTTELASRTPRVILRRLDLSSLRDSLPRPSKLTPNKTDSPRAKGRFLCVLCGKNMYFLARLRQHIQSKHPDRADSIKLQSVRGVRQERSCQFCGKQFQWRRKLDQHLAVHHGVRFGNFHCSVCGKIFAEESLRNRHEKNHGTEKISVESSVWKSSGTQTLSNPVSGLKSSCYLCGKKLQSQVRLRQHMTTKHGVAYGTFPCSVCGKIFRENTLRRRHEANHWKNKRNLLFSANGVQEQKIDVPELAETTSLEPLPSKPSSGLRLLISKEAAGNLNVVQCVDPADAVASNFAIDAAEKQSFPCAHCGKVYNNCFRRKHHLISVHGIGRNEFRCNQCGKVFPGKAQLRRHLRNHLMPRRVCRICNKSFDSRVGWENHLEAHQGIKYTCSVCSKEYKGRKSFENHFKLFHDEKRKHVTFSCDICERSFKTRTLLKDHKIGLHKVQKKPFTCVVCGRGFLRRCLLHQHLEKRHSNEQIEGAIVVDPLTDGVPDSCVNLHALGKSVGGANGDDFQESSMTQRDDADKELMTAGLNKDPSVYDGGVVDIDSLEHLQDVEIGQSFENENTCGIFTNSEKAEILGDAPTLGLTEQDEQSHRDEIASCDEVSEHGIGQDSNANCKEQEETEASNRSFALFAEISDLDGPSTESDGKQRWLCGFCGKSHCSQFRRKQHIIAVHGVGRGKFPCNVCGKVFPGKSMRNRHVKNHLVPKETCDVCNKSFGTVLGWKDHLESHEGKIHTCAKCPKVFSVRRMLQIHVKLYHNEKKDSLSFPCDTCGKVFRTSTVLKDHKIAIHKIGQKPATCVVCSKGFLRKCLLQQHLEKRHTDAEIKRAKELQKLERPSEDSELILHDEEPPDVESKESTKGTKRSTLCFECGKSFHSTYRLRQHLAKSHGIERGQFPCGVCNKIFPEKSLLHRHERDHQKPRLVCDSCGKSFCGTAFSSFQNHVEAHKMIPHPCPECQKVYYSQGHLEGHRKTCHSQASVLSCKECGRILKSASSMRQHMVSQHGEKPFACEFCSKRFVSKANLRSHWQVHSGVRPFHCDQCPKAFFEKRVLADHKRSHSGARPYSCPICAETFTYSGSLNNHRKLKHPEIFGRRDIFPKKKRPQPHSSLP